MSLSFDDINEKYNLSSKLLYLIKYKKKIIIYKNYYSDSIILHIIGIYYLYVKKNIF